ncbi:MAG: hypothetical protein ACXAD7_06075 [Candidatus Kariarchaeaceae archaeon]|jgi:hypothetical protein
MNIIDIVPKAIQDQVCWIKITDDGITIKIKKPQLLQKPEYVLNFDVIARIGYQEKGPTEKILQGDLFTIYLDGNWSLSFDMKINPLFANQDEFNAFRDILEDYLQPMYFDLKGNRYYDYQQVTKQPWYEKGRVYFEIDEQGNAFDPNAILDEIIYPDISSDVIDADLSNYSESSPNDQRSNTFNPNNPAYKAARDNRSNQLNPRHPGYRSSRDRR